MNHEQKAIRDTQRALQVEALMENVFLKEAFEKLEKEYYDAWRATKISKEGQFARERLFQAINIIGKVQDHLRHIIEDGKLAKAHLAQIRGRQAA